MLKNNLNPMFAIYLICLLFIINSPIVYTQSVIYVGLFENKTIPGTNIKDDCKYMAIPQDNNTNSWTCEAGHFCLSPNLSVKCTAGFICPENAAQPSYCCPGYYCSEDAKNIHICPKGSFCTLGSTSPILCHHLGFCPKGTDIANRYYIAVVIFFAAIITVIIFTVKNKADQLKIAKYNKLLFNEQKIKYETFLDHKNRKFDIEFENIGLVLPSGVSIMEGVSGKLYRGRTCAIMGPSGAGKTIFISLLTGKVKKTSGIIKVNGVEEDLVKYHKLVGFVPQEDVMLRELTVREILMHSAMMRLPTDMKREDKKQKVIETIRFLELSNVMNSVIGNEEKRGISGGQRKRVNIGMELVAEPSILFLDEPTSGLDSSTSLEVCTLLKKIAHEQELMVAAVIHSPSPQVFETFDDLLLLGKGGKIIYTGPRERALEYFSDIGFDCPPQESPADFMMKIANGKAQPSEEGVIIDVFGAWEEFRVEKSIKRKSYVSFIKFNTDFEKAPPSKTFGQKIKSAFSIINIPLTSFIQDTTYYISDVFSEFSDFLKGIVFCRTKDPIRDTPNVFVSFSLLFKRACLQIYGNKKKFVLDQLLHLGCGIFISIATNKFSYIGKAPPELCQITPSVISAYCLIANDTLQQVGTYVALGATFAGISASGSTFGYEKVVYWRDTAAGMRTIPYFLAKFIADIPRIILAAIMYTGAFLTIFPFRATIFELYTIILLTYLAAWTMGYCLSAIVSKDKLGLVGTGVVIGWGLVISGANPTLTEVLESNSYKYIRWLWYVSAQRWEIEAVYLKEINPRRWHEIHNEPLSYSYNLNNYSTCLRSILLISFGWIVSAFLAMRLLNRDKQK